MEPKHKKAVIRRLRCDAVSRRGTVWGWDRDSLPDLDGVPHVGHEGHQKGRSVSALWIP